MQQGKISAVFMRGGTSKAVIFRRADLPADQASWSGIFRAVIGSPDAYGRQLDGMGGGVSSLSKICIVGPASRADADVDYTFAQVAVKDGSVDFAGNCGNMSSAIGPFALEAGLVPVPLGSKATVRIHNTNTNKLILSHFNVVDGVAAVEGDMSLDGVTGTGSPIRLDFMDPGGTKSGKLLPTGQALDLLEVPGLGLIEMTMIDAANPCVFVSAEAFGATGTELPETLEGMPVLLERLEFVRRSASVLMGLANSQEQAAQRKVLPIIAMVSAMKASPLLSGKILHATEADILVRTISTGQPHRAVPVTGALCLGIACRVVGSVPQRLLSVTQPDADVRIAHPSGVFVAAAKVTHKEGAVFAEFATAYRTARRLFEGSVFYRTGLV